MPESQKTDTPKFPDSPRSIKAIKKAAKLLQEKKHMTLAKQASEFKKWTDVNVSRLKIVQFQLDRSKWTRFVNGPVSYKTDDPDLPKAAWYWFFENHDYVIEETWLTSPDDHPAIPNAIVPTLHRFLLADNTEPNIDTLRKMEGSYVAYRPSFIDHEHIMVMALTCGIENDISRFKIEMVAMNEDGDDLPETVDGYALPYQSSILFQGKLVETTSPFIFILTDLMTDPNSGKISRADGALLVGASGSLPSAYPITIRRTSSPVEPKVFDVESFRANIKAHKTIMQDLNRGIVQWRSNPV